MKTKISAVAFATAFSVFGCGGGGSDGSGGNSGGGTSTSPVITDPPKVTVLLVSPVAGALNIPANVNPTLEFSVANVAVNTPLFSHMRASLACSGRKIDVGVATTSGVNNLIVLLEPATNALVVGDNCVPSVAFDTTGPAGTISTNVDGAPFVVMLPKPGCVAPAVHNDKLDICAVPELTKIQSAQLPKGCAYAATSQSCFKDAMTYALTGIVVNSRPTMVVPYQTVDPNSGNPLWGMTLLYADDNTPVGIASNGTSISSAGTPTKIDWTMGTPADNVVVGNGGKCTKFTWGVTGFVPAGDIGC